MARKNEFCFAHNKCKTDPDSIYLLGGRSKIFKADNTIFVSFFFFCKHFAHFNSWAEMKLVAQTS